MVDVGVREDHRVQFPRIKREIPVAAGSVSSRRALEQPAFQQQAAAIDFEQMLRTGDGLGGAVESGFS